MIIVVFGLPGSGKSYFASQLAKVISAEYINSDKLRKELFPSTTYSNEEKIAVYNKMLKKTDEAILAKRNLVLDATFFKNEIRKKFQKEVNTNETLFFIEVIADENIIHERLSKPREFSDADIEVYKKIKEQWEPMKENHLIIISTNDNLQEMLRKAKDYLHIGHE